MRHQDQQAIQKLKEQLASMQESGNKDHETIEEENDPEEIAARIKKLYARLSDLGNRGDNKSSDVKGKREKQKKGGKEGLENL